MKDPSHQPLKLLVREGKAIFMLEKMFFFCYNGLINAKICDTTPAFSTFRIVSVNQCLGANSGSRNGLARAPGHIW